MTEKEVRAILVQVLENQQHILWCFGEWSKAGIIDKPGTKLRKQTWELLRKLKGGK